MQQISLEKCFPFSLKFGPLQQWQGWQKIFLQNLQKYSRWQKIIKLDGIFDFGWEIIMKKKQ
jgi:hypothetical protein